MAMTCAKVKELAPGFVLGALDVDDMIAVQDHLDGCDKPHPEIDDFGGVIPYLAQAVVPIEPPAWLRESVIAAARADTRARQRVGKGTEHRIAEHAPIVAPAPAAEVPAATPVAPVVIPFPKRVWAQRRQLATWGTRVAAALLVVALGGYAVAVQGELKKSASPTPNIVQYIGQGSRLAALVPLDPSSKAGGLAVLQQTGHLLVDIHSLQATTGDQTYVVWVTGSNGQAIKLGSFTVDAGGRATQEFENAPNTPDLFLYVTKEANGNVTTPTGPIIVSGTLSL